jgi:hypothetical protein
MNRAIIVFAAILTVGIGLGHRAISAGGLSDGIELSQDQVDQLPDQIDAWTITNREKISGSALELLECTANGNLAYRNVATEANVIVTVMSGPSGPLAAHTPEVCYSSKAYVVDSVPELLEINLGDGTKCELRVVNLVPRSDNHEPLTVIYGWNDGTTWKAPAPTWSRAVYAGTQSLVKLQAAIVTTGDSSVASTKDRQAQLKKFLTQFIPVINAQLEAQP